MFTSFPFTIYKRVKSYSGKSSNPVKISGTNRSQGTLEPSRIDTLSGRAIVSLAYGSGPHVLALSQNGEVFSWGHNAFGQLG